MESNSIAKTVIASSLLTLLVVIGLLYGLKEPLLDWLRTEVVEPAVTGETSVVVTRDELITNTIETVNPAVVSVVVTKDVPVYERYYEEYSPFGGWFEGFMVPRVRENGTEEREVGGGSGFIVSEDGLVITNRHVVADEDARYSILTNDGESHEVSVVARDPVLDIAVLQIEELPDEYELTVLSFGDSSTLKLGQSVIAIGNALAEFRNSVSVGVVSGLLRSIVAGDGMGMSEQLDEVIQTDAAINPGNSGGPLLNLSGEVVGVNVAASFGAENIGFALPANAVKSVVESVKEYGEIIRPFLGVRYQMLSERMIEVNNLTVEYGAIILPGDTSDELAVLPGSPADKAGLEANDIILAVDEVELDTRTLAQVLRSKAVGDTITLKVLHDGEEKTVTATLERAPQ